MEGIEKPHTDKYKEITNNWNYDASCTLTSLPVWDLQNFKRLVFVVLSVYIPMRGKWSNNEPDLVINQEKRSSLKLAYQIAE
jgi:hypothetical protein